MSRRPGRNQASEKRGDQGQLMHITHPPQIPDLNLVHGVRMRFVAVAAAAKTAITFQNLLDTWLVATSATTASDLFHSVKIRAVEVWSLGIISAATTVQVTYFGSAVGLYGPAKSVSDTSMGVQPAHIRAVPQALSPPAQFQQSNNNTAFELTCPAGAVIDIEMTFRNKFGLNKAAQNATVGATTGAVGNRGLDGIAIATTNFTPVSDNPM